MFAGGELRVGRGSCPGASAACSACLSFPSLAPARRVRLRAPARRDYVWGWRVRSFPVGFARPHRCASFARGRQVILHFISFNIHTNVYGVFAT